MQEIRAVIRPSKLETLREALRALPDFPGISIAKIEGFTAPKLISKQSAAEQLLDYSPKLMLHIVTSDAMTELIIQTIKKHCSTGQTGDGLIWVNQLVSANKIKNGEPIT